MATELPRALIEVNYYQAAQEYLRKLPLEHFMESTPQATQRKITLASLSLVEAQRPDFHLFNELLVQYPLPRKKKKKPGQVVPDNMVVRHDQPIKAEGSYDVPLQPAGPFWVLEYVSKNNRRKDYDDNMRKYEQELKVPYYLLFVPDEQELTLYRHTGEKYVTVFPSEEGRYPIPELDIELAILDGWVRYWYRGELLPLPADLMNQLNEAKQRLAQTEQQLDEERRQRLSAEEEIARLRAELEKLRE
jgi:Uma2 family endonuclease